MRTDAITEATLLAADADLRAEQIALQRVDEARAITRPEHIGRLHVETEYDELEAEQPPLWEAEGTVASRSAEGAAAGQDLAADTDEALAVGQRALAEAAREQYLTTLTVLRPYVRRPRHAGVSHVLTKTGLFIGDGVGLASAALWLGEVPAIAAAIAISAATATLTAGLSGAEVKDLRSRAFRRTDPDRLPASLQPWGHLFVASDAGRAYVRALIYVSVSIAASLAVAILALRSIVEDPVVGVVFGAVAAAIAAASWVSSYMHADEIADVIDGARGVYEREARRAQKLASSVPWQQRAESTTEAASLRAEHAKRGEAASARLRALRARVLRLNPGVAGHGAAVRPDGVGQTTRRGGER